MRALLFIGCLTFFFQEIPFKPNAEFDLKLKYEFRHRNVVSNDAIHLNETIEEQQRKTNSAMLPFVAVNIRMVTLSEEEVRVKVTDNKGKTLLGKKVKQEDIISFNLGFTDDMKDRVTPYEYTVSLQNSDRKDLSRVVISVGEDGTFVVNGEKRGKF